MSITVSSQLVANESLFEYARNHRIKDNFNDLVIITRNGNIFANRLILAYHSKYLERIFTTSALKYDKTIEICHIDKVSLEALIDFFYCGTINISNQNVMNLLSGAEYLQIDEVKQSCIVFLQSNVKPANSMKMFKDATQYLNNEQKNEMLRYISTNIDEVAETDEFKALSKDELISCINDLHGIHAKETSIYQAVINWVRCNEEARSNNFPDLFKTLKLRRFPVEFMKDDVLDEALVTINTEICLRPAVTTFYDLVKAERYESKKSHLVTLGGMNTCEKVTIVFKVSQEARLNYSDFDVGFISHCSLKFDDHIYSIGGRSKRCNQDIEPTNEVVKLDLKKGNARWERFASMKEKRMWMGADVFCDRIFVAGGADAQNNSIASTEFYFPANKEWKLASPLNQCRQGNALVYCDECLYALGGWDKGNYLSSVERLEDVEGVWQEIKSMQTPRRWFAAVNCEGVVYAVGGKSGKSRMTRLKTVEKYDSVADKWSYVAEMNNTRCALSACVLHGKIYVVGGVDVDGKTVKEIECYNPKMDSWRVVTNVNDELQHHTLVAL